MKRCNLTQMAQDSTNSTTSFTPAPRPPARLLTAEEVVAELTKEIEAESLTEVARKYGIAAQQLSDIRHGRAQLSGKALTKLRLRMHKFFERLQDGKGK
jgi:hypothetical protein